jgi:Flp pilus assembly protein TadD
MEEKRVCLLTRLALMNAVLVLVLSACSMPRIVVLKDPLTAGEHVDLGLAYEHKGMLDLAEKEYLKAADTQDGWAVPYFNLGNIAYGKNDLKAAEKYYRKALELDKQNPDIMNNLANLLHRTGRDVEAGALVEKALSIQPKDEYLDTRRIINNPDGQAPTGKGDK